MLGLVLLVGWAGFQSDTYQRSSMLRRAPVTETLETRDFGVPQVSRWARADLTSSLAQVYASIGNPEAGKKLFMQKNPLPEVLASSYRFTLAAEWAQLGELSRAVHLADDCTLAADRLSAYTAILDLVPKK